MNTVDGNKIIAEFLGAEFAYYDKKKMYKDPYMYGQYISMFEKTGHWWRCSLTPNDNFSWEFPHDLDYHKNYNSLMTVIEKIKFTIHNQGSFQIDLLNGVARFEIDNHVIFTQKTLEDGELINTIWEGVIAFIKWFNDAAKTDVSIKSNKNDSGNDEYCEVKYNY